MTDKQTTQQAKIDAVKSALDYAQQSMQTVVQELVKLTDAFPPPENEAIRRLKERLGLIAKNWDDACIAAEADLRRLQSGFEA
ncbi:hypothetical protein [Gluconobacter kondonii]|uniref:Uncharacterized protein n=1 Tax=Gluconobacter kondonii TaxID=941463 RepID=A0ABQ5WXT4_9PROT|nr:hypothetical protein [Gluconobacter kondonii]GBR36688.1 hypothetical protein AA3266_2445 [Gluconobacter kondonii NBRC 3266]GLQ67379.1 hypothetical protein GCM10007870_29640 [Gluconobacter kondonii]